MNITELYIQKLMDDEHLWFNTKERNLTENHIGWIEFIDEEVHYEILDKHISTGATLTCKGNASKMTSLYNSSVMI